MGFAALRDAITTKDQIGQSCQTEYLPSGGRHI